MGQKNQEKFEELLDRVEKGRATRNTGLRSTASSTGSSTTTSTGTATFSSSTSTSVGFSRTDYDVDWPVKDDLNCGRRVVQLAESTSGVDGVVPSSVAPDLSETCGFAASIREGLWVNTIDLMQEVGVPTGYIETRDGDTDKMRFWASLLESYNVPWTISEVEFLNPDPKLSERQAVLEFGVVDNGTRSIKQRVKEELREIYGTGTAYSRLKCLQSSHTEADVTYFPLASRRFGVILPGVFETRSLPDLDGVMDDARHERVIKEGGGIEW